MSTEGVVALDTYSEDQLASFALWSSPSGTSNSVFVLDEVESHPSSVVHVRDSFERSEPLPFVSTPVSSSTCGISPRYVASTTKNGRNSAEAQSPNSSVILLDEDSFSDYIAPLPFDSTPFLSTVTTHRVSLDVSPIRPTPTAKRRKLLSTPERPFQSSHSSSNTECDTDFAFIDLSMEPSSCNTDCNRSLVTHGEFESTLQPAFQSDSTKSPSLSHIVDVVCCKSKCLASFSLNDLDKCRGSYMNCSRQEQQQFLLDTLSITAAKHNGKVVHSFILCGKQLCRSAFLLVLGISEKRLRKATRLYATGTVVAPSKSQPQFKSPKRDDAYAWMERYFSRIGDKMPHIQQIHLPYFLSKKAVYEFLVQDFTLLGFQSDEIISRSHFYALWKKEFPNCIIPKVSYNYSIAIVKTLHFYLCIL